MFSTKPGLVAVAALALVIFISTTPASSIAAEDYQIDVVADGLEWPWSLAFLPGDRMLVTERTGQLRIIDNGALVEDPVDNVPAVFSDGQGGLFDVLPGRDFESSQLIYLAFAHGTDAANTTRLVRGRLEDGRLEEIQVLFTAAPTRDRPVHFGGRMAWLADGTLVLGLGDGFDYREQAQKLDSHIGTIVRLNADGSVPADNPFVDRDGALPEIYSYGHRNIQGLVFDADSGRLWQHEHGPRGGDEINRIEPGGNYGWPIATHGIDYSGAMVSPFKTRPGMIDPELTWTPSIAPAGMALYDGDLFPDWRGDLFVAALVDRSLHRIEVEDGQIIGRHRLLEELEERLRDVRTGPDGALYVLTDAENGRLLRITPTR